MRICVQQEGVQDANHLNSFLLHTNLGSPEIRLWDGVEHARCLLRSALELHTCDGEGQEGELAEGEFEQHCRPPHSLDHPTGIRAVPRWSKMAGPSTSRLDIKAVSPTALKLGCLGWTAGAETSLPLRGIWMAYPHVHHSTPMILFYR